MLVNHEQLIGLAVKTKSGQHIGKTEGLIIELDTQSVYQYQVKPTGIAHLFDKELVIHRDQVISITADELVVEDLASPAPGESTRAKKTKTTLEAEPITSSK